MYRKKKLIIEKKDSSTTTDLTSYLNTEDTTDYDTNEYYDGTETTETTDARQIRRGTREVGVGRGRGTREVGVGRGRGTREVVDKGVNKKQKQPEEREMIYKSIADSNYRKPYYGSVQDNYSLEEIKQKLTGYVSLKSIADKKILTMLPIFRTWVRYYNTETKQFRTGGLLMKVVYPEYIMLVNTTNNVTWSVQLKNNIIYIQHPDKIMEKMEKSEDKRKEKKIKETKQQEKLIKDKLYEMYINGELKKRDG